ncbi:hypothetical protein SAMN04489761_4327 [Tenacibaculum sp. MAR_2009_124]|uniref:hypothetical protein n=1 Tax=Tenacibaculum sp. MAR_2009_124 TaxID=1250059 RepID=UPI00089BF3E4|nr:hypothetical protein [Tenacibaculum sp. MAR_2009_124]SED11792.1 hypothetical protein SAMN04489761_4327 [Tenacibaculum sp. MAR_2009_124]
MCQRRINRAHKKSITPSYKHLTKSEYQLIKKIEKYDQAQKGLYAPLTGFYATCQRLPNGSVNVEILTDQQLDLWDDLLKKTQILSKYEEDEIERVRHKFNSHQFTYSQSF